MACNVIYVIHSNSINVQWGVPLYAKIMNSVLTGIIAVCLMITLGFLIVTLNTFVKGSSMTELKTSRIRRFFIYFTLAFTFLAAINIWSTSKEWDLTVSPLDWPVNIFNLLITVEFFYDILAIGYLVSIHHQNFKPKRRQYYSEVDEETIEDHVSVYEDDGTSIHTGTVLHTQIDENDLLTAPKVVEYKELPKDLIGTAIKAALGGDMDFELGTKSTRTRGISERNTRSLLAPI